MKADFAILTVRPDEYAAIHTRFTPNPYRDPISQHTYGISQVQTRDGKTCTVAIARTSQPGNDASQQIANSMIHDLDPQMLLVVGIGGGIPDNDFTLGDVIVSSRIHNFDLNAIKGNHTAYDVTGGIHPLISEITANLYLYQNWFGDWNSEASIRKPRPYLFPTEERLQWLIDKDIDEAWQDKLVEALKWHFDSFVTGIRAPKYLTGPIASSNSLIRSDAVLAQWLQGARSIRAVEMEVAGVYQAAQQISKQYPVMAIRGISDIVGLKRDDDWAQYATQTAAAFAYAFIRAGIVEPREDKSSLLATTPIATPQSPSIQPSHSSQENVNMPIQNSQNANATKIFTIYADVDHLHKERLETQLSPYTWNGKMDLWDRSRINSTPGLIQSAINEHIDSSQVILLLVSPHFPASKQCLIEMARAMQARITNNTIIIPIYIRPLEWPEAPFEGLLALPRSGKPVISWSNADEAWYDVARDISKTCEQLRKISK